MVFQKAARDTTTRTAEEPGNQESTMEAEPKRCSADLPRLSLSAMKNILDRHIHIPHIDDGRPHPYFEQIVPASAQNPTPA